MLDEGVPRDNIFIDDGVSGWKEIKRRGFESCIESCRHAALADEVTLFVSNDKRFGRLAAEGMLLLADLEKAGVKVYDLLNKKYLSVLGDQFVETGIKLLLAQADSQRLSLETKRNYQQRRAQGRAMGGEVPWGYRRVTGDKGKLEIVPELREPLREIIELVKTGLPLAQIAARVEAGEFGVKPPRRKNAKHPWPASRLRDWLKLPTLRGHFFYKQNGIVVQKVYDVHEALLSDAEWRIIEQRIQDNIENHARWQERKQPLSGRYLRCGVCGGKAYVHRSSNGRFARCKDTKGCEHSTGTPVAVVVDAIGAALTKQANGIASAMVQPQIDEALAQRITALERERDQAAADAARSSRSGYQVILDEIDAELRSLRHQAQTPPVDLAEYREYLELFKDPGWTEYMTTEGLYGLFCSVVRVVEIRDAKVQNVVTVWG